MGEQVVPSRPSAPAAANRITRILDHALPEGERFPVDVVRVATEISAQVYPEEPIDDAMGADLPGLEGALVRSRSAQKGWGIFYNDRVSSPGRINFTLGHEFGHYMLHRWEYPEGFHCSTENTLDWGSTAAQVEREANTFAATLLMPLNDYRQQIAADVRPSLEDIGACATRYQVSLIAATLRWLEYTARPSVLVVSRDAFILWARSSKAAMKSGLFFRTARQDPIEVPPESLAAEAAEGKLQAASRDLAPGHWFAEAGCTELVLHSDNYDFTISLLHTEASKRWEDCPHEETSETGTRPRQFGID